MKLQELRSSRGLTQAVVADELGLPLNTYRNYERGERQMPVDVMFGLADYYGVTLDYLMGRDTSTEGHEKTQLEVLYDLLDEDGRSILMRMARALVKSGDYLSV